MTFGKKGRPSEDRLARQREIFGAVSPLILEIGVRRLSMRQAADAACLSIGGLYHYFPTKRDLVLHGLRPDAIYRYCEDFHAEFGRLAYLDPRRYINIGIDIVAEQVAFCRPAIYAALELGTESFWEIIEGLLAGTVGDFEVNFRRIAPRASEQELHRCGRAVRRSISAALIDKSVSPDEFRDELRLLVNGYIARAGRGELAAVESLAGTSTGV